MRRESNRNEPGWPLQVFYDGACPICSREVTHYRRRDSHGRLRCIDVAAPSFAASDYGLDAAAVDRVMHVRAADGRLYTGVDAFVAIWDAIGIRWAPALTRIPGVLGLMRCAYAMFARNRRWLTGRCGHATCSTSSPR